MANARNIGMMDLRRRTRFTKEPRSGARTLGYSLVDHFESNGRIQDRVACAICNRHRSGAELHWKSIIADLDFEMVILQYARR